MTMSRNALQFCAALGALLYGTAAPAQGLLTEHRLSAGLADFGNHLLRRRRVPALPLHVATEVIDDHARAVRGQRQRVRAAKAPPAAGHDCNPARQPAGH